MRAVQPALFWAAFFFNSLWVVVAEQPPGNFLPNPGFEAMPEELLGRGKQLADGDTFSLSGWWGKGQTGNARVAGDTRDKHGGETSLRFDFLDADIDNNVTVYCRIHGLKPRTIYRLRGKIKVRNINWVYSFCYVSEYDKDGKKVGQIGTRTLNYPSSDGFEERDIFFITSPGTAWGEVEMRWRGRPMTVGIVRQPSIVWMDDFRFEEVGPVFPAEGDYLSEGFESDTLDGWVLSEIGAHWEPTGPGYGDARSPQISNEQAHGGSRSLKMVPTWGSITRPFDREISDCVVTGWFYEMVSNPNDKCRAIMLESDDGKSVGIGTHRESVSNYACYLNGKAAVADIPKSQKWHQFKFDVTRGEGVTCYIDGVEVAGTDEIDRFSRIRIGENLWRGSTAFVDDIQIEAKSEF